MRITPCESCPIRLATIKLLATICASSAETPPACKRAVAKCANFSVAITGIGKPGVLNVGFDQITAIVAALHTLRWPRCSTGSNFALAGESECGGFDRGWI